MFIQGVVKKNRICDDVVCFDSVSRLATAGLVERLLIKGGVESYDTLRRVHDLYCTAARQLYLVDISHSRLLPVLLQYFSIYALLQNSNWR